MKSPSGEVRTRILIGESGDIVVRVRDDDGSERIEKTGSPQEIAVETAVLEWCAGRLPVPKVLRKGPGFLAMSVLPGVDLSMASPECAAGIIAEALNLIHAIPFAGCPLPASWELRLAQAERRVRQGLVDESDFDTENLGRSAGDILAELRSLKALPPSDPVSFTHGDACLPNFLTQDGRLSGIVDLGRAGVTHPAQDWALALRSVRDRFGPEVELLLHERVPKHSRDGDLLQRFRFH